MTPPNSTDSTDTSGPSRLPFIIGGVVVVAIAVAAIVWFFVLPDDADPVADLKEDAGSGETVEVEEGGLDGTWTVVPGSDEEGTFAGYLVDEVFASGAREVTANGRSSAVEGTLTVADGSVTDAEVVVDTTQLRSDQGRRDNAIKTRGLQTEQFPEARFELSEPVTLPTDMADGKVATVPVEGKLTLRDQTQDVSVDLDVRPLGDEFTILGRIPIAFADYGIEAPNIGGFVSVEDEGQIELRINFGRQSEG